MAKIKTTEETPVVEAAPKKAAPKKARWVLRNSADGDICVCSECEEVIPVTNQRGTVCAHRFCPNCGKQMEG